jgi:hypothetical protein
MHMQLVNLRKQAQEGREGRGGRLVSEAIAKRIHRLRKESWKAKGAGGGRVAGRR